MDLHEFLSLEYSEEIASTIAAGFSRERPVTLRANTLKSSVEEVCHALKEAGIAFKPVPWYRDALILEGAQESDIMKTPLFQEGRIYLQSLSSMLPPLYLEPKAGESILDMTAAPGGKTCELLALSGGEALITACERDKIRFDRLKYNLERQGAGRVSAMCCDATGLDDFFSFDKILLDAPCSGTGTVTPNNPIRFSPEYVQKCVRMQEKLLCKALKLLKKGGTLVYSTCSVTKDENERLVNRVLQSANARLVSIQPFEGVPTLPAADGMVAVMPTALYEGFFVAKITK